MTAARRAVFAPLLIVSLFLPATAHAGRIHMEGPGNHVCAGTFDDMGDCERYLKEHMAVGGYACNRCVGPSGGGSANGGSGGAASAAAVGQAVSGMVNTAGRAIQDFSNINRADAAKRVELKKTGEAALQGVEDMNNQTGQLRVSSAGLRDRLRRTAAGNVPAPQDRSQDLVCDQASNSCEEAQAENSHLGDYGRESAVLVGSMVEGGEEVAGDLAVDALGDLTGERMGTEEAGVAGEAIAKIGTEAGKEGAGIGAGETTEEAQKQLDDLEKCMDEEKAGTDLIRKAAAQAACYSAYQRASKKVLGSAAGFSGLFARAKMFTDAAEHALSHYAEHVVDGAEHFMTSVAGCAASACPSR